MQSEKARTPSTLSLSRSSESEIKNLAIRVVKVLENTKDDKDALRALALEEINLVTLLEKEKNALVYEIFNHLIQKPISYSKEQGIISFLNILASMRIECGERFPKFYEGTFGKYLFKIIDIIYKRFDDIEKDFFLRVDEGALLGRLCFLDLKSLALLFGVLDRLGKLFDETKECGMEFFFRKCHKQQEEDVRRIIATDTDLMKKIVSQYIAHGNFLRLFNILPLPWLKKNKELFPNFTKEQFETFFERQQILYKKKRIEEEANFRDFEFKELRKYLEVGYKFEPPSAGYHNYREIISDYYIEHRYDNVTPDPERLNIITSERKEGLHYLQETMVTLNLLQRTFERINHARAIALYYQDVACMKKEWQEGGREL